MVYVLGCLEGRHYIECSVRKCARQVEALGRRSEPHPIFFWLATLGTGVDPAQFTPNREKRKIGGGEQSSQVERSAVE